MNWLAIMRNGLVVGWQDLLTFWPNWRVWTFTHALQAITTAATWTLMGKMLASDQVVQFLLIGQVAIIGPRFAGWALQSFTWDRMFVGTYPLLVAAPSSLVPVMLGRSAIWLFNGLATSAIMLVVLLPLFRLTVAPLVFVEVLGILAVVCASAYGLAFLLGAFVNWMPRTRNVVHNATFIIMAGICGVTVPVTFWPIWVQHIAHLLPVTHGLQSIRALLAGEASGEIVRGVFTEGVIGLAWLGVGMVALDRTVLAARRNGAIDIL